MSEAILFLTAALVCVPIAVRLRLGSVLGYLVAGVAIGPAALGLVRDPAALLHFSELGVVLMLFVIGLELEPRRLWGLRGAVFGGGSLQMLACGGLLFPIGLAAGWTWQASLIGALALALSSTAIVVSLMQERNLLPTPVGRIGFAMLLYQDIAAIPLLALAAVLGASVPASAPAAHAYSGPLWQMGAVVAVIVAGRYGAYPLMRFIAAMQVRELFTAVALLMVLGVAALMQGVGLSMGLGAFCAGVLLASSEYRHALEADILPFKGLLLGLFFIAVGMNMDLALLTGSPVQVGLGVLGVVAAKGLALWLLAQRLGLGARERALLAILLSQVGEFAFVVLAAAKLSGAMPGPDADLLTLMAALSMVSTPVLLNGYDRWCRSANQRPDADEVPDTRPTVLIAGFGRYGQTVARMLLAAGIHPTVIDHDAGTVDSARRFGFTVYFGDATQPDLLHAAGIRQARAMVIAIDDIPQCNRLVDMLRHHYPGVTLVVRARDALHAMDLSERAVGPIEREVFESSLRSGRAALEILGMDRAQAKQFADNFRRYSNDFLRKAREDRHNEEDLIARVRQAREQFEQEMREDQIRQTRHDDPSGWRL